MDQNLCRKKLTWRDWKWEFGRGCGMAHFCALLLGLLLFPCLFASPASAASAVRFMGSSGNVTVSEKKSGVLSRLSVGLGAEFWNEKIMGRVYDDWKISETSAAGKEALKNFTRAGSIAGYMNLGTIDAIHLPLPINFIFIGFEGNGNQAFKLGEEELERWFTKLDHVFEHTRVPQLGEALTPFYRVKGSGERQHHLPFMSYSHYNYSVHGIELNSKVTSVFERAIKLLARKDSSADENTDAPTWQVDVNGISHIFRSLVHYLDFENAYNIFVLNPKRDPSHGTYGYRAGLSKLEIKMFQGDAEKRAALLTTKNPVKDLLAGLDDAKNPLYEKHPFARFSWTTAADENTATWADNINGALDSIENALKLKSDEEVTLWFARLILNGNDVQLASALRLGLGQDSGLQPECLVDTWVGNERWSFVDLSAGPFTWGPTVGGDGIRSELSLPSVESSFGSPEMEAGVDAAAVDKEFRNLWSEKFERRHGGGDDRQVELLLAEIDVYKFLADKHCRGRTGGNAFCGEFQERLEEGRQELLKIEKDARVAGNKRIKVMKNGIKAVELLKHFDEGNIFGFVNQHTQNFSVARDSFLAHLGSVLSSSLKHVVTPSTADGAFHYYETVYFQVFFITEEKIKHDGLLPVNKDALKTALAGLVLPSQKTTFAFQPLSLSDDPALAMAFASAKRASIVPMLLANGTFKSADRVYLDSLTLQHHIKQLHFEKDHKSSPRSTIEIPIFWFLRSGREPLLLDKHYQAKALPDMVFVVQSTNAAWESHLQCNGESILWDLRQPSKAAVAAVAEHMGGLLPSPITFSPAHENAMQDWLWSVGSHPFSSTSAGWHVLQFHNDAMARSYIVTVLDESIEVVNSGVQILTRDRPQAGTFEAFRSHEHSLRVSYNQVVKMWKRIAGYHEQLKYSEAVQALSLLESSALSFFSKANETVAALHPVYCTQQHKLVFRKDFAAGIAIVVLLICLRLVMRPKVGKPKIN